MITPVILLSDSSAGKRRKQSSNCRCVGIGGIFAMSLMSYLLSAIVLHEQQVSPTQYIDDGIPQIEDAASTPRDATIPKPKTTLVHFDPYFMGGFRNQHMRFVAFVNFAVLHNVSQILLPSLRWLDPYNRPNSIQHELLFDVEYWNSRAAGFGLPILVNYDPNVLESFIPSTGGRIGSNEHPIAIPCWNETSSLYSGLAEAHIRHPDTNIRRIDIWEQIGRASHLSHCRRTVDDKRENDPKRIEWAASKDPTNKVHRFTHLVGHGGLGGGGGYLWWEYGDLQRNRQSASETFMINGKEVQIYPEHEHVERAIYQILRPSQQLRSAIDDTMDMAMQNTTTYARERNTTIRPPRTLALHPRVEQEMLTHKCAQFMEPNLTKVFERIQTFPPLYNANSNSEYRFDLVFIAVSKIEIEKEPDSEGDNDALKQIMRQNRIVLQHARGHGLFGGIPILESGTYSAANVEFQERIQPRIQHNRNSSEEISFASAGDLGVIELVASVINFYTAVRADIFVGVKGSSYSTDVFSARYYQSKEEGGSENYVLGPEGIHQVFGPAAPHACMI